MHSSQTFDDIEIPTVFNNNSVGIKMKFNSDKDNVDDFYKKFVIISKLHNFSESQISKEFLLALDHISFIYLLQNPMFEQMVEDNKINELVDYLSSRFSKKNNLSYKLELNNLTQNFNESVETFATTLLNSMKKAYPQNYDEMNNLIGKTIFLKGIKDVHIRNKLLKVIENNSLNEIIQIAVKLELFNEQSNLLTSNFNQINLNCSEINAFSESYSKNVVDPNFHKPSNNENLNRFSEYKQQTYSNGENSNSKNNQIKSNNDWNNNLECACCKNNHCFSPSLNGANTDKNVRSGGMTYGYDRKQNYNQQHDNSQNNWNSHNKLRWNNNQERNKNFQYNPNYNEQVSGRNNYQNTNFNRNIGAGNNTTGNIHYNRG